MSDRLDEMRSILALEVDALLVGYRGYGKSEGSPSEEGLYRDAEAAYRYLTEAEKVPPAEIFFYGQSLGGAVAVDLAVKRPCRGLLLESSFTSIRDMAWDVLPWLPIGRLVRPRYASIEKIPRVGSPLLLQHGEADETVPIRQGRRLFAAAREPKRFFSYPRAGHNDLSVVGGAAYYRRVSDFLASALEREWVGEKR